MRSLLFLTLMAVPPAVAVITGVIALRWRVQHRLALLLELRPMDETKPDLEAWTVFFRSLFAITAPAWRRWLVGVPRLAFEFVSDAGRVRARC